MLAEKDKHYFFEDSHGALALPFTFAFLPYNDEEACSVSFLRFSSSVMILEENVEYLYQPVLRPP